MAIECPADGVLLTVLAEEGSVIVPDRYWL